MRTRLGLVLCCLVVAGLFSFQNRPVEAAISSNCQISLGAWQSGAEMPNNHIEAATAVINGKMYLFGGFRDSSLRVTTRVDVYNPATNKWETASNPLRSMPIGLTHIQAVIDGKWVWIAGGFQGDHPGKPTNKVLKYDTQNDQWYYGPSLPQPRASGFFTRIGRELHYAGGLSYDRDTTYANHWVLNLDNQSAGWKTSVDLPNKRVQGGGITIGGIFYTVGGQYKHDHSPVDVKYLYAFDNSTKKWTQKANLAMGRSHDEPGTVNIEGRIVIVGGRANQNGMGQIKNISEYNPSKNAWRELRQLPNALIAPNAAYINGKLIVTGGGTNWNTANKKTYISSVSFINCG